LKPDLKSKEERPCNNNTLPESPWLHANPLQAFEAFKRASRDLGGEAAPRARAGHPVGARGWTLENTDAYR